MIGLDLEGKEEIIEDRKLKTEKGKQIWEKRIWGLQGRG
jgi:hypothetical protein